MLEFAPEINKSIGKSIAPLLHLVHVNFRLTPDMLSYIGCFCSFIAAGLVLYGQIPTAMILLIISLFFDGLDGAVARYYHLETKFGKMLDLACDRIGETVLIFSLVLVKLVEPKIAILALFSIFLVTIIKDKSKFDPGFKRISILLGYVLSFNVAVTIMFFVNLIGFIIGLIIVDYRHQKHQDTL